MRPLDNTDDEERLQQVEQLNQVVTDRAPTHGMLGLWESSETEHKTNLFQWL